MKKALSLLLAGALMAGMAGCGGGTTESQAPAESQAAAGGKVVKIGVFEPSTGDSASGGKKETLGMQYANQETPTVEVGGET